MRWTGHKWQHGSTNCNSIIKCLKIILINPVKNTNPEVIFLKRGHWRCRPDWPTLVMHPKNNPTLPEIEKFKCMNRKLAIYKMALLIHFMEINLFWCMKILIWPHKAFDPTVYYKGPRNHLIKNLSQKLRENQTSTAIKNSCCVPCTQNLYSFMKNFFGKCNTKKIN